MLLSAIKTALPLLPVFLPTAACSIFSGSSSSNIPEQATILLPLPTEGPVNKKDYNQEWTNPTWKLLADGSLEVGHKANRTRRKFGSCRIHLEFCIPKMADQQGQARGNSGVYIQDRYEVQLLDSFGLVAKDNDCGAIYKIAPPLINACRQPGEWQSYDIEFQAALFNKAGKVVKSPLISVRHNGVLIHKNQTLPHATGGGAKGVVRRGPIRLQDHGNPVRFRNIWILEQASKGK